MSAHFRHQGTGATPVRRQLLERLLGSRVRARALSWLLTHHHERFYVRQLESLLGEKVANLSIELSRLADMGILTCRTEGRQKYYQADTTCPIFPDLQRVAIKTMGLADVLQSALGPLRDRIAAAFIYGSFAKADTRPGSDVDVMIIGHVTFGEVVSALRKAQDTLAREVNPTVYPPEEFRQKSVHQHFVRSVLREPKIFLIGDERELAGLG
ncbi:MAG: ArsR family transcriptional regulator [Planctomycetes bacterium]|nr:ArsR family transcriptional regulator [Planctomycetota bacterium]